MILALIALAVFTVLAIALWIGQRSLVFFPERSDPGSAADRLTDASDARLQTSDGLELSAWRVNPAEPNGMAVLYLPGNAGNRLSRAEIGQAVADQGFTVLLVDYRGYGGNPGSPSEEGLARDADAGVDYLREAGFEESRMLIVGESIGTGVAASLASRIAPAGVVLRSPYESLAALARHQYGIPLGFLLRDRFDTLSAIGAVTAPVLVLAGDADEVIPVSQSEAVAALVPQLHSLVVVPGAGHNDALWFGEPLAARIAEFAASLDPL